MTERRYSEREVRKQILRARGFSRDSLLDRESTREEQKEINFNVTYYPVFQNVKKLSCEVCKSVNDPSHFKSRVTDGTFNIPKGPLDCNSNHAIHLFKCKQCKYRFSYVGSTKTKFRYRINYYKPTDRKFRKKYIEKDLAILIKKSKLNQKLFQKQYCTEGHQGIEN